MNVFYNVGWLIILFRWSRKFGIVEIPRLPFLKTEFNLLRLHFLIEDFVGFFIKEFSIF